MIFGVSQANTSCLDLLIMEENKQGFQTQTCVEEIGGIITITTAHPEAQFLGLASHSKLLSCGLLACSVTSVISYSLQLHGLQPTRLLCPWDFPGVNTGVGCHFLVQGIFLTQGSDLCLLCLLHWQADFLPLVPPGRPPHRPVQFSHSVVSDSF